MAAVGGLAIGMCIVFGGFVLLLLAELCYVFYWKRRSSWRRISGVPATEIFSAADRSAANLTFSREVGLVGAGDSADPQLLAKLFPTGSSSSSCNSGPYMQGVLGGPKLLFTIDEETKEEMEYEEPVDFHDKNAFSSTPQQQPMLNNLKCQKQQWQYGYIKQQQQRHQKVKYEESRYHWKSASPSPQQIIYSDSPFQRSSSFRSSTSEYSSSSPARPRYSLYAGSYPSSSTSSPPRRSASSSFPSSCTASPWRNYDLADSRLRNEFEDMGSISNDEEDPCVFYDAEADRFSSRRSTEFGTPASSDRFSSRRSTEFGTPVASPSHLLGSTISSTSPPLTPPLTPIRAPLAAYSIPLPTQTYSFSARNPNNSSSYIN